MPLLHQTHASSLREALLDELVAPWCRQIAKMHYIILTIYIYLPLRFPFKYSTGTNVAYCTPVVNVMDIHWTL